MAEETRVVGLILLKFPTILRLRMANRKIQRLVMWQGGGKGEVSPCTARRSKVVAARRPCVSRSVRYFAFVDILNVDSLQWL